MNQVETGSQYSWLWYPFDRLIGRGFWIHGLLQFLYTPGSTNIAGWKMDPGWVDVFPIENGDIPASYVSLPEGIWDVYRMYMCVLHICVYTSVLCYM